MTLLQQVSDAGQRDPPRRVAYLVSPDLINSSDALACHSGRSIRVHSLIHNLSLLKYQVGNDEGSASGGDDHALDSSDKLNGGDHALLRKMLDPEGLVESNSTGEANVIIPPLARRDQLTVFHDSGYVDALLSEDGGDPADGGNLPRKRQRLDGDSSTKSNSPARGGKDAEKYGLVDVSCRPSFDCVRPFLVD